jgi:acyl-CoA dehydrogenase
MAKSAVAAKASPREHDSDFLEDKVVTARFYGEHLLPQANGLIPTIKAGNKLLAKARF